MPNADAENSVLSCELCSKTFKSASGWKYHLGKRVIFIFSVVYVVVTLNDYIYLS
jgi:hypothetical protein